MAPEVADLKMGWTERCRMDLTTSLAAVASLGAVELEGTFGFVNRLGVARLADMVVDTLAAAGSVAVHIVLEEVALVVEAVAR